MFKSLHFFTQVTIFCSIFYFPFSYAEESQSDNKETKDKCIDKEEFIETKHEILINGQPLAYTAIAGNLLLEDKNCKPNASLFFVSYVKDVDASETSRPITFCFNGGPGSSSVWLHVGVFGPKKVNLTDNGDALPPYRLVDNPYSLLDITDLVFIDPISTGYSHAIPVSDAKNFHGVETDIKAMANFIQAYLSKYNRWESPKFIAGESYGTTRAAALADYLHDHQFIYVNGIVLISSVLNFQSIDFSVGNDLPYLLFLPSYTATAWYHGRLSPELQEKNLDEVLNLARQFVMNDYNQALFKGDLLGKQEREHVINQMANLTGLSPEYIDNSQLRVGMMQFAKELMRNNQRTVGRFDGRFKGIDSNAIGEKFEYDPSAEAIFGAFTATLNHYLKNDLKWSSNTPYKILTNVQPWDYGSGNQYLNVAENLRSVMTKNPYLTVFVGNGYYDLATPFFATEYTFNHLGLNNVLLNHVTMKYYPAGHMMYVHKPSLIKMKDDLANYYLQTLADQEDAEKNPVVIGR